MNLRDIAENRHEDDVHAVIQNLAHRIVSDHWAVYALQNQYERLISGESERSKLITYSLLKPTIFEGFKSVIIAGACMEDTILHRLWTAQGVKLEPVHPSLARDLRYERHPNGHLVTIRYAIEAEWSKTLRDKQMEVDERSLKLIDRIVTCVGNALGDEPFLWMGNKDLPNGILGGNADAERLPNSPHGLNEYQGYHNVVVLSALNPPPAHFHFLEGFGISGNEVKTSHYRSAVYQAVMRCSARNPKDSTPKTFVVMDRSTAEWLAGLFPGAKVEPLPGMSVVPRKGDPGRPRQHGSNAEKTRAYRENKKREQLAQLDLINGTSLVVGRYPWFDQEVRAQMREFAGSRDENTINEGGIVTPPLTSGTAFSSVYDAIPLDHVDYTDEDSFIAGLGDLHQREVAAKEASGVFSPAHFVAGKSAETSRGLDNITHIRGIWLDNDGGDLSPTEFVSFFPYLWIVVWNTYSSTPEKPRWRAFIPTSHAMSMDVHRLVIQQVERVLNQEGYWGKKQLEKGRSIKVRRSHGFDESKFNAASLFYLPCQAKNPKHSFFEDYNDPTRGPLDLHVWVENCIVDQRPEPDPLPAPPPDPHPSSTGPAVRDTSGGLEALRQKLRADKANTFIGRQEAKVAQAVSNWRFAPRGTGHNAFFRLAVALQNACLDEYEIRQKLYEEAGFGNSPTERRGEIDGILKSLSRRGLLGRTAR